MNQIEVETLKEIIRLSDVVLQGKVENLPHMKKLKALAEELIEFKDYNKHYAWKLAQD